MFGKKKKKRKTEIISTSKTLLSTKSSHLGKMNWLIQILEEKQLVAMWSV